MLTFQQRRDTILSQFAQAKADLETLVKNSIFLNFQRNKPATISNTFSGAILQSKNVCCLG